MERKQVIKEILEWCKYLAVAFAIGFLVKHTLIVNAEVVSPSMECTIMTGSRIMGSRLVISELDRFDIIIFEFPDDRTSDPFVKRIIGLPNEKVEIRDGLVYIDDSTNPLDNSFVNGIALGNYGPFIVPKDSYFVLGDNRNKSHDSKDWVNPFVHRDMVLGRICLEWFPKPKILSY